MKAFLLVCFLFSQRLFAQAPNTAELHLKFEGLTPPLRGNIMIKICKADGSIVQKKVHPLSQQKAELKLNLPPGQYAIASFYDENGNQKLDRNLAGFPKEKYGFSNNVRGTFGPPALSEQIFTFKADQTLSIRLQ